MLSTSAISVVLTGTSRGLGEALFDQYLQANARIMSLSRSFTERQQEVAAAHPQQIVLRRTDLADSAALPSREELSTFLDTGQDLAAAMLVHNAAVVGPIGLIGGLDTEELYNSVLVNLVAPMVLTNTFIAAAPPNLTAVNVAYITTGAIRHPYPGWAAYCATKAAAERFMESARVCTDARCTVRIIDPGALDTAMHAQLRKQGVGLPGHEHIMHRQSIGALADPMAVARQIVTETMRIPMRLSNDPHGGAVDAGKPGLGVTTPHDRALPATD